MNRTRLLHRRWIVASLGALLALAVTACGSSSKSSSSSAGGGGSTTSASSSGSSSSGGVDLTALKAIVAKHESATKIGPTVPIKKPIPKGKTIDYVNCGAPACVIQQQTFTAAAHVLGWKVVDINAVPTPQSVQAAFQQVVRNKPDGVLSAGFGASLYPEQLKALNKEGVVVMSSTGAQESGQDGIKFDPLPPSTTDGAMRIIADKALVDQGGAGETGSILLTGYPIVKLYTQAYTGEIHARCPSCKQVQLTVNPTDIGTKAGQEITNWLRTNPGIKSLYLSYDPLGDGLAAAAKGAGVTLPKLYSWGAGLDGIQALNVGQRTALMPEPMAEGQWQVVDAFARVFTGQPVSQSQPFQNFVIWSPSLHNVPPLTKPFPAIVKTYQQQFEKLWAGK